METPNEERFRVSVDLSIIIVNYNVKEFLQNLLVSIRRSIDGLSSEIIVIDNASDDGSVEIIKEKFPDVRLIANRENVGFGAANNQGLEASCGKYILLLNPDTIVQEDTFTKLIRFFETKPDAGLVGCKILNSDGTLQLACRRGFPGPWTSFCKVTGLSKLFPKSRIFAKYNLTYLDENQTYEVDAISGAFMMMRRELYEKIGGFDSQFFMYGEDLDLCYRSQKAGFRNYYYHDTQIIHYKGESTKRSSLDETKVFYDAMHLFVKKHLSSSFIVQAILRFAIFLRKLVAFINIYRLVLIASLLDFVFFDLSLFFADKIYALEGWHGFPPQAIYIIYIVPALIQTIIASITGAYRRDSISVLRILYSIFIGFFILSSVTFFFKQYAYSRAIIIITYILLFFLLPLWRIILKMVFRVGIIDNFNKIRTLIVGTNKDSVYLADKLRQKFTSLHNIVGLIGISRKDVGTKINGFEVLGSMDNIEKVIRENRINEVIFSSNELSFNQMLSIVSTCQGENIDFKVSGTEHDFLVGKSSVTMLDEIPLLELNYNISQLPHRISKTVMDYAVAVPVLILLYPLIYFLQKLHPKKSDIRKFVLNLPSVVSGRASLVGPGKIHDINLYLGRPGLTGLWYTERLSSDEEAEKLDIFYAKNQNIWLDLEILGKTIGIMFNEGKNNGKNGS